MAKSVFGDFFDTFSTLRAGRPGKTFLRLLGDFGARGVETPVYGDCNRDYGVRWQILILDTSQGQKQQVLSGPNRAMQLRCAMRFESHTPKSLAMPKGFFFASDAKTH